MTEKGKNNIPYTAADIEKYLQGKLTADEMHAMEKAALDDPFLADAIEGMQSLKTRASGSFDADVTELKQRLQQRISSNKKLVPFSYKRSWLQVAAAVFILITGVVTYYFLHNNLTQHNFIATDKKEKKADEIADSTKQFIAPTVPEAKQDSAATETASELRRSLPAATGKAITKKHAPININKDSINIARGLAVNDNALANKEEKKAAAPALADKEKTTTSQSYYNPSTQDDKQNSFSGKVMDLHNKPIALASVELKDKKIVALTDHDGNFKLNVKSSDSIVNAEINSDGYDPAFITLNNNNSHNVIILKETKNNLQEVAVSGNSKLRMAATRQKTAQDAEPITGWNEYNKYLEKNKKSANDSLSLKGPVVVSFTIRKNGKPTNLIIEQSLGPAYDAEAMRLIKEGPGWKLLRGKKANVSVIVNF